MFVCTMNDCGLIFDEPESINLPFDDGVGWRDEWWPCCPRCSDTEFTEAEECEECGEWWNPMKLEDGICPDCMRDNQVAKRWKEITV